MSESLEGKPNGLAENNSLVEMAEDKQKERDLAPEVSEKLAEAYEWTKEQVDKIPSEVYESPEAFGKGLISTIITVLEESRAKYGEDSYKEPVPEELTKLLEDLFDGEKPDWIYEVRSNRHYIPEDCAYSIVYLGVKKYIKQRGFSDDVCELVHEMVEDYCRKTFLQGDLGIDTDEEKLIDIRTQDFCKTKNYRSSEKYRLATERAKADPSVLDELSRLREEINRVHKSGYDLRGNHSFNEEAFGEAFHITGTSLSQIANRLDVNRRY